MALRQLHIGVVADHDPFAACELIEGISQFAAENRDIVIRTIGNAAAHVVECDAVVFLNGPISTIRMLLRRGIAVVNVEPFPPMPKLPVICIEPDNARVGEIGARQLLGLGFPRFAYLTFSHGSWSQDRCKAFATTIRNAGFPCMELRPPRNARYSDIIDGDILPKLLSQLQRPVALMVANDDFSRRVIDICAARGWIVPDEIAILGIDNGRMFCDAPPVTLSSIDLDRCQMGYVAAQCLERVLRKKTCVYQNLRIEPRGVVVRESTAALGFSDADVKAAIYFIRERAFDGINVQDVARHVSLSRSTLERRFFDALNRSPGDEIRHIRLERAEKLLRQTNRSILDVSLDIGLSSLPYFCHSFKKHFGSTPSDYRKKMSPRSNNTMQ